MGSPQELFSSTKLANAIFVTSTTNDQTDVVVLWSDYSLDVHFRATSTVVTQLQLAAALPEGGRGDLGRSIGDINADGAADFIFLAHSSPIGSDTRSCVFPFPSFGDCRVPELDPS